MYEDRALDTYDIRSPAFRDLAGTLDEEAATQGFTQVKLKVGDGLADDVRPMRVARGPCGPAVRIGIDANQRWNLGAAVGWGARARRVRAVVGRGVR